MDHWDQSVCLRQTVCFRLARFFCGRMISSPTMVRRISSGCLSTFVGTGGLAAARSRHGSDTTLWCHSLPCRRFATSTVRTIRCNIFDGPIGSVDGGFFGRSKPLPYRGLGIFFGVFLNFCRGRRPRRPVPFVVTFSTDRLGSVGGGTDDQISFLRRTFLTNFTRSCII